MTATQLDIFASPGPSGSYRRTDPSTSQLAAERSRAVGGGQRLRVLAALAARFDGMTDYELEQATGIPRHIAARRRKDLVERGLVVRAGLDTRKTDRGCDAIVWAVTGEGRRALAAA